MEPLHKNIFVFGADAFNLQQMQALDTEHLYRFHELFSHQEVKAAPEFPVQQLLNGATERLKHFPHSINAIVGYWDFPVSTMLPLLRKPFHLPSASFEAVLKCEHKYWSRLEQSKVIPDYLPNYCGVNPFDDNYSQQITVDFPFWIKPVKSVSSYLGFKVSNHKQLKHAIQQIREGIFRFAKPFNYLLQFAELPNDIAAIDGNHCIVEELISIGRQCTLEGYVYNGQVTVYGVVDSIRDAQHRSTFLRYQYPSSIPQSVQQRMIAVATRFLKHIQYDNAPFNIEFYWQRSNNSISLLEINSRISKSHCPLFQAVDGASNHKVMLEVALGQQPDFPQRRGKYRIAAKFMWRIYEDAIVTRVPTADELDDICRQFPDVTIQLAAEAGIQLSSLPDQDSYSYEIAVIFVGGNSQAELLQKYHDLQNAIAIEFEPVG
ncbi:ATP-grasp domain-containing protein [Kangiella shandongensis]|uniref:ATP-grasp domain-containing protein n=1 Tax=Kangiella shandongensis TaxID=2763258 RepID=UPI001CBE4FE9|nr:ATP-grasp domain-containing protein [Kangiella shandongensis]